MRKIILGNKKIELSDFEHIVFDDQSQIELEERQLDFVSNNYDFLRHYSEDKIIYGVNTGFGPMAQYVIPETDRTGLQYNLIRSHASGMGDMLSTEMCRATVLARLNSLLRGRSGIHVETINLLKDMLNQGIYPVIYSHGGVGASGDLVQLAHVGLAMIGEGEVHYKGEIRNAKEVFEIEGIKPLKIRLREGLALMNGTSTMTGVGLINIIRARKLLNWSIAMSAMINEIVASFDDHVHELLHTAKEHPGQNYVAGEMRRLLSGSGLIKNRKRDFYSRPTNGRVLKTKLQEYYSLRCVPQILGPVYDSIESASNVLIGELNSANDNPLTFHESEEVLHGGNFHGDYVSLEMDKLKLVVTKMSMLCERQLNFLLNDRLNGILTPFINSGRLGYNFGLQGTQFTATSTVAENQTLSNPMYVHSIPCNNDNQDIVSMGTNSALITSKVIDNAFDVISIELLAIIHAVQHLDVASKLAPNSSDIYNRFLEAIDFPAEDTPFYSELKRVRSMMEGKEINVQVKR